MATMHASIASYRYILPPAACVGVLCVGAAYARSSFVYVLEEVLETATTMLHCNMRLEAYVAAAGGILLIAFTGPLASYSYVLQYLLIGTQPGKCQVPAAAPVKPLKARDPSHGPYVVPQPLISMAVWIGQMLSMILPPTHPHVAYFMRAQRRRLLAGHAVTFNLSSHRIRHSFEDLESCEMLERRFGKRRRNLVGWPYQALQKVVAPQQPPAALAKIALEGSRWQLKDRGQEGGGEACADAAVRVEEDVSAGGTRPVASGERMRRSSLSSPRARPLQVPQTSLGAVEDDETGRRGAGSGCGSVAVPSGQPAGEDAGSWTVEASCGSASQPVSAPCSEGSVSYEDAREVLLGDDPVANTALSSLGLDRGCPTGIQQMVPESFLLQFGSALGEQPCTEALKERGLPGPWGSRDSVFGVPSDDRCELSGWELIIEEKSETLSYWAWRRPLRAGLYMYRTHSVLEDMSAADLRVFQLDDRARFLWDDTALEDMKLPMPATSATESEVAYYCAKWPRPMSNREYVYARRVWDRVLDGGCYCVSVACHHPAAPHHTRNVRITDYISCYLIRDARSALGRPAGAAELISIYFEDASSRPSFVNLAVRKGLWMFTNKYESALRAYTRLRCKSQPSAEGAAPDDASQGDRAGSGAAMTDGRGSRPWNRLAAEMRRARTGKVRLSSLFRKALQAKRQVLMCIFTVALYAAR